MRGEGKKSLEDAQHYNILKIPIKCILFCDCCRYLLSQGADRNLLTEEGETAADLGG